MAGSQPYQQNTGRPMQSFHQKEPLPFTPQYAEWVLRKASLDELAPGEERSWGRVVSRKTDVDSDELQAEVKKQRKQNEKNRTSTRKIHESIHSRKARKAIDLFVEEENERLGRHSREIEWKLVGVKPTYYEYGVPMHLKTIQLILKTQLKPHVRAESRPRRAQRPDGVEIIDIDEPRRLSRDEEHDELNYGPPGPPPPPPNMRPDPHGPGNGGPPGPPPPPPNMGPGGPPRNGGPPGPPPPPPNMGPGGPPRNGGPPGPPPPPPMGPRDGPHGHGGPPGPPPPPPMGPGGPPGPPPPPPYGNGNGGPPGPPPPPPHMGPGGPGGPPGPPPPSPHMGPGGPDGSRNNGGPPGPPPPPPGIGFDGPRGNGGPPGPPPPPPQFEMPMPPMPPTPPSMRHSMHADELMINPLLLKKKNSLSKLTRRLRALDTEEEGSTLSSRSSRSSRRGRRHRRDFSDDESEDEDWIDIPSKYSSSRKSTRGKRNRRSRSRSRVTRLRSRTRSRSRLRSHRDASRTRSHRDKSRTRSRSRSRARSGRSYSRSTRSRFPAPPMGKHFHSPRMEVIIKHVPAPSSDRPASDRDSRRSSDRESDRESHREIPSSPPHDFHQKVAKWNTSPVPSLTHSNSTRSSTSSFFDAGASDFSHAGGSIFSSPPASPTLEPFHDHALSKLPPLKPKKGSLHNILNDGHRRPGGVQGPVFRDHDHARRDDYPVNKAPPPPPRAPVAPVSRNAPPPPRDPYARPPPNVDGYASDVPRHARPSVHFWPHPRDPGLPRQKTSLPTREGLDERERFLEQRRMRERWHREEEARRREEEEAREYMVRVRRRGEPRFDGPPRGGPRLREREVRW